MKPIQLIAAKALIVDDKARVLVLRQSDDADVENAGRYHAPGGEVNAGESLKDALMREVKEETGLNVHIGRLITVVEWPAHIRGKDYQCFGVFYVCSVDGSNDIKMSEEHTDFAWVDAKSAKTLDLLPPLKELIEEVLTQPNVQ